MKMLELYTLLSIPLEYIFLRIVCISIGHWRGFFVSYHEILWMLGRFVSFKCYKHWTPPPLCYNLDVTNPSSQNMKIGIFKSTALNFVGFRWKSVTLVSPFFTSKLDGYHFRKEHSLLVDKNFNSYVFALGVSLNVPAENTCNDSISPCSKLHIALWMGGVSFYGHLEPRSRTFRVSENGFLEPGACLWNCSHEKPLMTANIAVSLVLKIAVLKICLFLCMLSGFVSTSRFALFLLQFAFIYLYASILAVAPESSVPQCPFLASFVFMYALFISLWYFV